MTDNEKIIDFNLENITIKNLKNLDTNERDSVLSKIILKFKKDFFQDRKQTLKKEQELLSKVSDTEHLKYLNLKNKINDTKNEAIYLIINNQLDDKVTEIFDAKINGLEKAFLELKKFLEKKYKHENLIAGKTFSELKKRDRKNINTESILDENARTTVSINQKEINKLSADVLRLIDYFRKVVTQKTEDNAECLEIDGQVYPNSFVLDKDEAVKYVYPGYNEKYLKRNRQRISKLLSDIGSLQIKATFLVKNLKEPGKQAKDAIMEINTELFKIGTNKTNNNQYIFYSKKLFDEIAKNRTIRPNWIQEIEDNKTYLLADYVCNYVSLNYARSNILPLRLKTKTLLRDVFKFTAKDKKLNPKRVIEKFFNYLDEFNTNSKNKEIFINNDYKNDISKYKAFKDFEDSTNIIEIKNGYLEYFENKKIQRLENLEKNKINQEQQKLIQKEVKKTLKKESKKTEKRNKL